MKKLFLILLLGLLSFPVFSQNSAEDQMLSKKEQRQLAREQRLSEKSDAAENSKMMTAEMLQDHRFILEADFLAGRTGSRYPVNSTLNFVMLDSTNAVIQIGSSSGIGYNGVGGITIEGRVTKYDLTKKTNKNGTSYSLTAYVMSSLGEYDIQFWISESGNAEATIRGNFSGSVTYSGRLVPLGQSRVYKGMTTL